MYPASFEYFAPTTLDEALGILERYEGDAKVLAGGQSLLPLMKLRFASPRAVVDINRIPGLDGLVEEDGVLLSGDIVQNQLVPGMPNADASPKSWLAILDKLEPLKPRFIVPDHGALGDGSLIGKQRGFMMDLQDRALALKRLGTSADEAGRIITAEFKTKYPDWTNLNSVPNVVRRVYAESP